MIIGENFSNLLKDTNPQIQKCQKFPAQEIEKKEKKAHIGTIIMKCSISKGKKKILLKADTEKRQINWKGNAFRLQRVCPEEENLRSTVRSTAVAARSLMRPDCLFQSRPRNISTPHALHAVWLWHPSHTGAGFVSLSQWNWVGLSGLLWLLNQQGPKEACVTSQASSLQGSAVSALTDAWLILGSCSCPKATYCKEAQISPCRQTKRTGPETGHSKGARGRGGERGRLGERKRALSDQPWPASVSPCSSSSHHLLGTAWETISPNQPSHACWIPNPKKLWETMKWLVVFQVATLWGDLLHWNI